MLRYEKLIKQYNCAIFRIIYLTFTRRKKVRYRSKHKTQHYDNAPTSLYFIFRNTVLFSYAPYPNKRYIHHQCNCT